MDMTVEHLSVWNAVHMYLKNDNHIKPYPKEISFRNTTYTHNMAKALPMALVRKSQHSAANQAFFLTEAAVSERFSRVSRQNNDSISIKALEHSRQQILKTSFQGFRRCWYANKG